MMHTSQYNDITTLGMPELPTGSVTVSEPPGTEVMGNTSATGVSNRLPRVDGRISWTKEINKLAMEMLLKE